MISYCNKREPANPKSLVRSHYRTVLAILTALLISWGCEEDPTVIGSNLLPGEDFAAMFSSDAFTINAYTMFDDSVRTTDSAYVLGRRYSPYFGTTSAEIVTQLNLTAPWPGLGFTIDSALLILTVTSYEGDTVNWDQQLEMWEISEYLYKDSVYYSNKPVEIERLLGVFELDTIKPNKSLEIEIPNSLATYLMRDTSKLFISSTVPDFRDFFRGIYLKLTDNPNDAFFGINSQTSTSGILIYYTNAAGGKGTYTFLFSDKSARYKRIVHDFSTADPEKKIKHINDFVKDTLVYMQKLNGVYTRLEIPGLEQFRDSLPLSVNKARLILPAHLDGELFTDATVPKSLLLRYLDSTGKKVFVPDIRMGQQYFGGYYLADKDHYYFNLAAFVQEYLEGRIAEPVMEIYMSPGFDADLILKANNASIRPRLELSYTRF